MKKGLLRVILVVSDPVRMSSAAYRRLRRSLRIGLTQSLAVRCAPHVFFICPLVRASSHRSQTKKPARLSSGRLCDPVRISSIACRRLRRSLRIGLTQKPSALLRRAWFFATVRLDEPARHASLMQKTLGIMPRVFVTPSGFKPETY